jgi:hypothetical protein
VARTFGQGVEKASAAVAISDRNYLLYAQTPSPSVVSGQYHLATKVPHMARRIPRRVAMPHTVQFRSFFAPQNPSCDV